MKFWSIILIGGMLCSGCGRKSDTVREISDNYPIVRFERLLFALNAEEPLADSLKVRYPLHFNLYMQGVLQLGNTDAPDFPHVLSFFLKDTIIREVYDSVQVKYPNLNLQEKELRKAFENYKVLFPRGTLPQIFTHISGFNQSIVVDSNVLGIGLDNYLGEDCVFYKMLATPVPMYMRRKMTEKDIVRDVMYGWLTTEYPFRPKRLDLLSGLIYQGKMVYVLESLLTDDSPAHLFGYLPAQLQWCRENEKEMWNFLVENDYLFENQQMLFRKYLDEAPFSSGMPMDSPGKAVVWCGYQIVKAYKERQAVCWDELVNEQDYHKILRGANYRP